MRDQASPLDLAALVTAFGRMTPCCTEAARSFPSLAIHPYIPDRCGAAPTNFVRLLRTIAAGHGESMIPFGVSLGG